MKIGSDSLWNLFLHFFCFVVFAFSYISGVSGCGCVCCRGVGELSLIHILHKQKKELRHCGLDDCTISEHFQSSVKYFQVGRYCISDRRTKGHGHPPFISDRRTKEHDTPSLREGRGGLPSSLRKGWGGLPLILSERLRVLAHASEQSSSGRAMLG